jgi:hypothetical protein
VTCLRSSILGRLKISLPLTVVFRRFPFFVPSDFGEYSGVNAIFPRRPVISLRVTVPQGALGFQSIRPSCLEIICRALEGILSPLEVTRLPLEATLPFQCVTGPLEIKGRLVEVTSPPQFFGGLPEISRRRLVIIFCEGITSGFLQSLRLSMDAIDSMSKSRSFILVDTNNIWPRASQCLTLV